MQENIMKTFKVRGFQVEIHSTFRLMASGDLVNVVVSIIIITKWL